VIDLPEVSEAAYAEVGATLNRILADPQAKNRTAIKTAFLDALLVCPNANASDLWHHVVYRQYCQILPSHRYQDPSQSWVRASGDALESLLETLYRPTLNSNGVEIIALISRADKVDALAEMGLTESVGNSKLDVALYTVEDGHRRIFGGVHVKASLAERVSDDIPASRAMMELGFWSPLWTLDVKSFPPPTGDLINRGELGSPTAPSDKRKYVEEHGAFDNCYTANSRSRPSEGATPSGKLIVNISLGNQPDRFLTDAIARANLVRSQRAASAPVPR
jgi:BsaWI restriction endonuclease type 2